MKIFNRNLTLNFCQSCMQNSRNFGKINTTVYSSEKLVIMELTKSLVNLILMKCSKFL